MPYRHRALALIAAVALPACAADHPTAPQPHLSTAAASLANVVGSGRATGHAEFTVTGNIESKYQFSAITTEYPAAKGRFELHRWFPDGRLLVMKGAVECMTVTPFGTDWVARIAGRVESLRVDNVEIVVPAFADRAIWSVRDNGEGNDASPDVASGMLNFRTAADAAAHCAVGLIRTGFVSTGGNIQVQPGWDVAAP